VRQYGWKSGTSRQITESLPFSILSNGLCARSGLKKQTGVPYSYNSLLSLCKQYMLITLIFMALRILHHLYPIFESFPHVSFQVFWGVTLCHWVCALPHFEGVYCVYLQELSRPRMDCVQAHIFWLDLQFTPNIRLRFLATGMKQRYKGKWSTVSHHSRRTLLKLKYINVHVSAQLWKSIIRR
jgi:hypothetical protein